MRKRHKDKARSCGLCKPHKRKMEKRWTAKDAEEHWCGEYEDVAYSTL